MLVRFSVENFLSFRDKTTFSMLASKEERHAESVPRIEKYGIGILPLAAIYGGNASGKTNFFVAIAFAKELIVVGTGIDAQIPVDRFLLDDRMADKPSRFVFEVLIEEAIYEFSFAITRAKVVEEKLVKIEPDEGIELTLYHRQDGELLFLDLTLLKSDDDEQFLGFVYRGTRANQLFLTNAISQNVDTFRQVYDWFKDSLKVIQTDARCGPLELLEKDAEMTIALNKLLPLLDTGITRIGVEKILLDHFPERLKRAWEERLNSGEENITELVLGDTLEIAREEGKLIGRRWATYHEKANGEEVRFDMRLESAGTQWLINLLPALHMLAEEKSGQTIIIDELDRSLHTLLTQRLIEHYNEACSADTRAQLIFSTHDALLMDDDLLRRDEMWLVERDAAGASSLSAISDFNDLDEDENISGSYLIGRFGGIPEFLHGRR